MQSPPINTPRRWGSQPIFLETRPRMIAGRCWIYTSIVTDGFLEQMSFIHSMHVFFHLLLDETNTFFILFYVS